MEVAVQSVLSLMEPSYLDAKTETAVAMSRLLFTGLISVADAVDGISKDELEVFAKFFGKYVFSEKLDVQKIIKTLQRRAAEVKEKASEPQRMQVLHDMCLMAQADGGIREQERDLLDKVATDLGIPVSFICQSLDNDKDLD
jgi:uncharacterized tellurite resistance protein B-like protein